MKAVFFEKLGGPEVLQYGEFSAPRPQNGEVIVRVKAAGLNRLDIWLREDKENALTIPMPHISGSDAAGIIEEINGESFLGRGNAYDCGGIIRFNAQFAGI